jgi:hypothetical protein
MPPITRLIMADRQRTQEREPRGNNPVEAQLFSVPGLSTSHGTRTEEDLHICPACDSKLVYPTDWAPAAARRWNVDLRCPECEWTGGGVYAQGIVDRFDEALDDGTEALLEDLNLLARANMEEETERFISAIWAEHVLPEDF